MWPFVLTGVLAKVGLGGVVYWYAAATGKDLPTNSTIGTIVAVSAGMAWYARRVNRPLQRTELFLFASGTALSDLALSVSFIAGLILYNGLDFSVHSMDLIFGVGETKLTAGDIWPIAILSLFSMLMTFAVSIAFAWLITRKLPRQR
jgi:hypothetical protein